MKTLSHPHHLMLDHLLLVQDEFPKREENRLSVWLRIPLIFLWHPLAIRERVWRCQMVVSWAVSSILSWYILGCIPLNLLYTLPFLRVYSTVSWQLSSVQSDRTQYNYSVPLPKASHLTEELPSSSWKFIYTCSSSHLCMQLNKFIPSWRRFARCTQY